MQKNERMLTANEKEFLQSLHQIISDNLSNASFGVEELANAVHLHRSSLARKLAKMNQPSPSNLILQQRMEEAMRLLTTTNWPLSQITFEVGFTELSNFSRAFKRYYGDSPSNVRNGSV